MTKSKAKASPKKGRPKSKYDNKKTRSFSLSQRTYDELKFLAKEHNARSPSELLEKLGHRELSFFEPTQCPLAAGRELIDNQLLSMAQSTDGLIDSTLAFAFRLAGQFGLSQDPDFIRRVILDSTLALFCLDYLEDIPAIDSPTAWLRWYILHTLENTNGPLLEESAVKINHSYSEDFIEKHLSQLFYARNKLARETRNVDLFALSLRMWPNKLYINQINQVCNALEPIPETGFNLILRGVKKFRIRWLRESEEPEKGKTRKIDELPKDAVEYIKLSQKKRLSRKEVESLRTLIKRGLSNPDYDFWANEIDFILTHRACTNGEEYKTAKEEARQSLVNCMEYEIANKKEAIDIELIDIQKLSEEKNLNLKIRYKKQIQNILISKVLSCLRQKDPSDSQKEVLFRSVIKPIRYTLELL